MASAPTPIQVITSPFTRFARTEAAGGIVLMAATFAALVWANSAWQHSYHHLLETDVSIGVGSLAVTANRHHWINDGLMSLFFFLVGMEIKREILVGELSSLRRAAFPILAAVGGMIVPAAIYLLLTHGHDLNSGWAVPISTDIAFALGLLALLGNRVPLSLKVFVSALAIVDDIFAVVVIALFYTAEIDTTSLLLGVAFIVASGIANLIGVRKPLVYALIGICAWAAVLRSGVHATIAGVLLSFTIPANNLLETPQFVQRVRGLLNRLELVSPGSSEEHSIIHTLEHDTELVQSPLHRIEQRLQPWVSFVVVPLFALANAGVNIGDHLTAAFRHPITLGIGLGLVVGKPVGIFLGAYLGVKTKLASSADDTNWSQIFGAGCLCGIGFTMALFVATLAFEDENLLEIGKIAILLGSTISGIGGLVLLSRKVATVDDHANSINA